MHSVQDLNYNVDQNLIDNDSMSAVIRAKKEIIWKLLTILKHK